MKNRLLLLVSVAALTVLAYQLITASTVFTQVVENEFIKNIKQKFQAHYSHQPQDRIYVQFDKSLYAAGETVWFSARIRDARWLAPSTQSDIVHVQVIAPSGNILQHQKLLIKDGITAGDYELPADASGGIYKIKAYTQWQLNDTDTGAFVYDIMVQDVMLPQVKCKLDFERKAYTAGDEVVALLTMNGVANEPLSNMPFTYRIKIDGKLNQEQQATTGSNGSMHVRFTLPKKLETTDVNLETSIIYQGKPQTMVRSVPVVLNKISLQVFPEGGDIIAGCENVIAFKAVNEFNKPADVSGIVTDDAGVQVASFKSLHQGMGTFAFLPQAHHTYTVTVTHPAQTTVVLPDALPQGFALHADVSNKQYINVNVEATQPEVVSMVAQVRGSIYYATEWTLQAGKNNLVIPTAAFPMGVCQLTLFDSKEIERCERLVFVGYDKRLNVAISTDKEYYGPREKVTATLKVTDERGMPMPARFGISVTNDALLSYADNRQGSILSALLLQPDIKEKIAEPDFYFSNHVLAAKALDCVMLTSGWRRFTWQQVMLPPIALKYMPERAVLAGTVIDATTGKPMAQAEVSFNAQTIFTNDDGVFKFQYFDLIEAKNLSVKKPGHAQYDEMISQYNQQKIIYMHPPIQELGAAMQLDNRRHKNVVWMAKAAEKNVVVNDMNDEIMDMEAPIPAIAEMNEADQPKGREILKPAQAGMFKRERMFAATTGDTTTTDRNNLASTLYWNPDLVVDKSGTKQFSFITNDALTSYKITAEGIATKGLLGSGNKIIVTQKLVGLQAMLPSHVVQNDLIHVPVTISNRANKAIDGQLQIKAPLGFVLQEKLTGAIHIEANSSKTVFVKYHVASWPGTDTLKVQFNAGNISDACKLPVHTLAQGYPVSLAFNGNAMHAKYQALINHAVPGSIKVNVTAFPSVVADLLTGIDGILREPNGCFEQTSMSSYPNILVRNYLKAAGINDAKLEARANDLIDRGYKKLISFETPQQGYEWFGGAPGHEALTAYGLLQFTDMQAVYAQVDNAMMQRTKQWLLSKRDGNGGYIRNARALDSFGAASKEVTDTYITYALAEAGYNDIDKELKLAYNVAIKSGDAYLLGLAANAHFANKKNKEAETLLEKLITQQDANGSFTGKTHSITRSTHQALAIETTSLAVMALLRSNNNVMSMQNAVTFLIKSRNGYGNFGNSQSTIMALKALTAYAQFAKQTNESGQLVCYLNNKLIGKKVYEAGNRNAIVLPNLEKHCANGKAQFEVAIEGAKQAMPHTLSIQYHTQLPISSDSCMVGLKVALNNHEIRIGETVRLTATINNKTNNGLPSTMVTLGIPSGCQLQMWQLKEMMEKNQLDYFEIKGNMLHIYYRQMKPAEIKTLHFDLLAEVPGIYEAPASSAYLYYTNEFKTWQQMPKLKIKI
ncbi:MAG: hypothetical protein JNK61_09135 [Bacteroidia bacterium]|nr:hypothetical protein [Bacteroidia bacterium]